MKKVLKFIVGIFAAEYLVLTKFAFFTDLMKNMSPSQHPALAQHIIEALVCVAVIANHIVTVSNPEKKISRRQNRTETILAKHRARKHQRVKKRKDMT